MCLSVECVCRVVCCQLLATDIRHERNVILQCIRFITQHFNLHHKDCQLRQIQSSTAAAAAAAAAATVISDSDAAESSAVLHKSTRCEADGDTVCCISENIVSSVCSSAEVSMLDANITATVNHITADTITHCSFNSDSALAETGVCVGDVSN